MLSVLNQEFQKNQEKETRKKQSTQNIQKLIFQNLDEHLRKIVQSQIRTKSLALPKRHAKKNLTGKIEESLARQMEVEQELFNSSSEQDTVFDKTHSEFESEDLFENK